MIESEPFPASPPLVQEGDVRQLDTGSASGALTVAGIATAVVVAMWFAFYFFVFLPRAAAP
jgi:hypothetical protein